MKAISRRLAKLEDRFATRIAMPDGWAKEELLKRIAGITERCGDVMLEGPDLEAVSRQAEEWLDNWRRLRAKEATDNFTLMGP